MDFFQFQVPTKIVFAPGLARDFSSELDLIDASRFILVTDRVLCELNLVDPVVAGIKKAGREVVAVFSDVPPDSGINTIQKCAALAKANGAEGLIALGGGSVMDTAKGANILMTLGGDLVEDYSGAQTIGKNLSPLIAIPTTAGTGSEVTEAIVVLDEKSNTKLSFVDSHLLPSLAILDPELTLGLPAKITAATALDALTHAIESMMSVERNPVADALALLAIQKIFSNIERAVQVGDDLSARSELLIASNLAGMAFNHAMVGVVHAVAHTIGGLFHVHHGTANGIFLPFGMEYNLGRREIEIASMAAAIGLKSSKNSLQTAKDCIKAVVDLRLRLHRTCGLPVTLSQAGIKKDQLNEIATKAPEDGASFYNPREVSAEDLLPFLERAY